MLMSEKPLDKFKGTDHYQHMDLDHDACYRAVSLRDIRFDGRFFTGVKTTGIYCRPICPARTPISKNVVFFPHCRGGTGSRFPSLPALPSRDCA